MRGDAVVDEKCHIRGQWRRQRQRARGRSCTRSTRFPASKSVLAPSERAGKCVNTLVSGRGLDHDGVDEGRGFSERWTTRAAHFFHVLVGDRCRWRHSPRCQRRSKSGALLVVQLRHMAPPRLRRTVLVAFQIHAHEIFVRNAGSAS